MLLEGARLRFAVHWPGTPVASPRMEGAGEVGGMPCGDVPGRVHVSIAGISAGHAAEQGLVLATARCDVPAPRAALARVRGTYLLDPARGLVLKAADQQAPPAGQDAPVQRSRCPRPAMDSLPWPRKADGTARRTLASGRGPAATAPPAPRTSSTRTGHAHNAPAALPLGRARVGAGNGTRGHDMAEVRHFCLAV